MQKVAVDHWPRLKWDKGVLRWADHNRWVANCTTTVKTMKDGRCKKWWRQCHVQASAIVIIYDSETIPKLDDKRRNCHGDGDRKMSVQLSISRRGKEKLEKGLHLFHDRSDTTQEKDDNSCRRRSSTDQSWTRIWGSHLEDPINTRTRDELEEFRIRTLRKQLRVSRHSDRKKSSCSPFDFK